MPQTKMKQLAMACGLLAGGLLISSNAVAAGPSAEMLANTCAGCHGTNGVSAGPAMPTIAGLPAEHTKSMMAQFKSGERPATIMKRIAEGYSDEQIQAIADHFAKQKWGNGNVSAAQSITATAIDPALAKKGASIQKKCEKCHEDNGVAQEDDTPRLAGQWLDYLLIKVSDYKDAALKVPQPEKMAKQIDEKSAEELHALAHFYASQKK